MKCGRRSDGSYCAEHTAERKRVRNADRPFARALIEAWVAQYGWWCPGWECDPHPDEDLTADHVLALANGGTNEGARAVLCRSCNARKGARRPLGGDMGETTDPRDPRLGHGANDVPVPQNDAYLVLSEAERAQGFVRPVRLSYRHLTCGSVTTMSRAIAETYARQPGFYGATYCVHCGMHRPVGADGEFVWDDDGSKVGS